MDNSGNEIYRVEAINEKSLAMSNVLISSKYKATIQELKITYLALQKVQLGQYERYGENVYIKFRGRELQKAMGVKGNSFFNRLVDTSEHMTGRTIGIVDPDNRRFMFVPFVTLAKYENGERRLDVIETFEILIHLQIKPHLFFDRLEKQLLK